MLGKSLGGAELHVPVPNIMDAVPGVSIAAGTPPAGGTLVLGPAPLELGKSFPPEKREARLPHTRMCED